MVTVCTQVFTLPAGRHTTPASSWCPQLWTPHPPWLHWAIILSFPTHLTLSSHIRPVPCPNDASPGADKAPSYPSSLQTILASCKFHELSQMVPHVPLYSTSTRPEDGELLGLTKRTMIRAKNNVAHFTCCSLFQCFKGSLLMFVIVYSYIYFYFFIGSFNIWSWKTRKDN